MAGNIGVISIGFITNTKGLVGGIDKAKQSISGITPVVNIAQASITKLAATAAAVAAPFLAISSVISNVSTAMEEIGETATAAKRIGTTSETLTGLQYAASTVGVGVDAFNDGIQDMTEKLGDGQMGAGDAREVLKSLGLELDTLANQDAATSFTQIADKISQLSSTAEQATIADKMFGGAGFELLPLLQQGSEGVEELTAKAQELGLTFSDVEANEVLQANQAIGEMKSLFTGIFRQLSVQLAPFITTIVKKITDMGLSGGSAADIITGGMEMAAKGVAFAADVVDSVGIAWLAVKKISLDVVAAILRGVASLAEKLEGFLNKLPGVEVSFGSSISNMAKKVQKEADAIGVELNERLIAPSAGEKVTKFFADVRAESKKTAEEMAKNSLSKGGNVAAIDFELVDKLKEMRSQIALLNGTSDEFTQQLERT